jgi:hypothetical protein
MKRLTILSIFLFAVLFVVVYNWRVEQQRYEPRIYSLAAGKELIVEITGDPDITWDTAALTLYSTGRQLKLSPSYMSGRHAQWRQRENKSPEEWKIQYTRPVPETAVGLGDIRDSADVSLYFQRRDKMTIAEIRHPGRYENIPNSLARLRQYISNAGYRLDGFYEEVYLVFETIEPDPALYETLLRYQVSKK